MKRLLVRFFVGLLLVFMLTKAMPAQTAPTHSVVLAWDAESTPVPNGVYNLYRAPLDPVALTCGTFIKTGNTGALTATDTSVVAGASYCYHITYFDPSTQSESPVSTPDVQAGPIPTVLPLAQPKNLHVVKVQ